MRGVSSIENATLQSGLAEIAAPTAVIWGERDRVIPVTIGTRLKRTIPGATLDVIAGARHFTPEEAPQSIADSLTRLLGR